MTQALYGLIVLFIIKLCTSLCSGKQSWLCFLNISQKQQVLLSEDFNADSIYNKLLILQ